MSLEGLFHETSDQMTEVRGPLQSVEFRLSFGTFLRAYLTYSILKNRVTLYTFGTILHFCQPRVFSFSNVKRACMGMHETADPSSESWSILHSSTIPRYIYYEDRDFSLTSDPIVGPNSF